MIAEGHHRSITQPLARRLRVSGSRLLTPGFSHSCTISPSLPRSARGSPRSVANKPFSINRHSVKSFRFHSYEECPFSPRFLSCKSPRIKRHFAKSFRSHSYKKRVGGAPMAGCDLGRRALRFFASLFHYFFVPPGFLSLLHHIITSLHRLTEEP